MMDIKELLDAIRLDCPDCGWSLMLDMSLLHPDRRHVRCPDCGSMFTTFIDPTARKASARRYIAAAYKWQSIPRIFSSGLFPPRWRKFKRWSYGLSQTMKQFEQGMTPEQKDDYQTDAFLWRVDAMPAPEWLNG